MKHGIPLVKWGLNPLESHSEEPHFRQWAEAFDAYCTQQNLIDSARMQNILYQALADGQLALPEKILLLSFDELNPQMAQFFALIDEQVCHVHHVNTPLLAVSQHRSCANHRELEITDAARWAAQCIQQEPSARIGIVIPTLSQERQQIERIFTAVFEPQYVLPEQGAHAPGFNLSAGQALAHTPIVADALMALHCYTQHSATIMDIERCAKFLQSPYLGCLNELPQRASLDNQLREHYMQLSIGQLHDYIKTNKIEAFDQALQQTLSNKPAVKQSAYQWSDYFRAQLAYLQWPGERELDTLEYQQWQLWQQVLEQFCQLDYVLPVMSLQDALFALEQLATQTQFQPKTTDSPIQVLGIFEAAGLLFDYLWVVGMDNENWPPAPKPNTLLPIALQKAHDMPRASAERELMLSQRLTDRFCQSARHIIFSYSKHEQDKVLYPSRLIADFPDVQPVLAVHPLDDYYQQQVSAKQQMSDLVSDCYGMPLLDVTHIKGGTQILKDQAACPFRAFALHRLALRPINDMQPGINPAQRGNLMHEALALIWKKLQTKNDLLALDAAALQSLIDHAITRAFSVVALPHVGEKLQQLERQRLSKLIDRWLDVEKQRPSFSVLYNEQRHKMTIAKLPITLRYDRVDQTAEGELFVIDYKSGQFSMRSWVGQRLDEPQVPLYCISQKNVIGAAIAQINSNAVVFKGIADDENIAPGLQTPSDLKRLDLPQQWPAVIEQWRESLGHLAKEFIAGYAAVKPKYHQQTCQYCTLQSFCRIRAAVNKV